MQTFRTDADRIVIDFPPSSEEAEILNALDDETCRNILDFLTEPKTVAEISNSCSIPTSTVYRKISVLTEANLIERAYRVQPHNGHPATYRRCIDRFVVDMGDER